MSASTPSVVFDLMDKFWNVRECTAPYTLSGRRVDLAFKYRLQTYDSVLSGPVRTERGGGGGLHMSTEEARAFCIRPTPNMYNQCFSFVNL